MEEPKRAIGDYEAGQNLCSEARKWCAVAYPDTPLFIMGPMDKINKRRGMDLFEW